MTIGERLREASAALAAVSETPRLDAEFLLSHALGMSRGKLLAALQQPLPPSDFDALLARRLQHEPVAYLLGEWEFFSLRLEVCAPLLVPRPETEHLVETGLAFLARWGPAPVLDLCTGTGCVAVALGKHSNAQVTATDVHPLAIEVARRNALLHGLHLACYQGDLFEALPAQNAPFSLIVSNPPYVKDGDWDTLSPAITHHEDPGALLAGVDGLDCIRRIVAEAPRWLAPGGMLALEIAEEQGEAVASLLAASGFQEVIVRQDLAGHDRIVSALRN